VAAAAPSRDKAAANAQPPAADARQQEKSTLPLKLFVLAVAIGLCITSLVGATLAFSNPRNRKEAGVMLVLGTLLPLLLLFL
jgi:hypothetical protein